MSVTLTTGVPGSGKTFKEVCDIVKHMLSPKSHFKYLYTDIQGFDFDLMTSRLKKNKLNQKCYELKYSILDKHISAMYEIYTDESKTEDDLIEYTKKHSLYKSLIVFDEAHNYFAIPTPQKIWFLTYHRHMFLEIVLITQNMSLIHRLYLKVVELYYDAHRRSNSLSSSFKYSFYTTPNFTKENRIDILTYKPDPKIFELYQSGDSVKSSKVVYKFIYIMLFAFVAIIAFSFYSYNNMITKTIDTSKTVAAAGLSNSPSSFSHSHSSFTPSYHLYFKCVNAGPGDNSWCKMDGAPTMYRYDYTFKSLEELGYHATFSRLYGTYLNIYQIRTYEYNIPESAIEKKFPRWYDYIQTLKEYKSVSSSDISLSDSISKSLSRNSSSSSDTSIPLR